MIMTKNVKSVNKSKVKRQLTPLRVIGIIIIAAFLAMKLEYY